MLSTCSCSKYTKNSRATSNIENNFVFEIFRVVFDCALVSPRPDAVLQHFLMNVEARVRPKIIVVLALSAQICQQLSSVLLIWKSAR